MDKNLTDNEIIKALECCNKNECDCDNCPLGDDGDCGVTLIKFSYDLINCLQAENERLRKSIDKADAQLSEYDDYIAQKQAELVKAKAEAYKEFAERLKKELFYKCGDINYSETCDTRKLIDNLLKEMVGEDDG